MFSFLDALFETPIIKVLGIAVFIGIIVGSPYYIPWFEHSTLGQALIEKGAWVQDFTLWPYDNGMKLINFWGILYFLVILGVIVGFIGIPILLVVMYIWGIISVLIHRIRESHVQQETLRKK